ncbi:thiamine phosphate synthase [Methylophilus medardicus]|uniref:Thiamine-phosphate synthase n=1 Tax=Methylophilus medardicus TaxID=2588534 RepID=A0A5B8CW89_9PROT|nr:thiamine phosphate synthase [Methylophilus medardicus]QDC45195.1 thiamine phosphate synthase [Methylophilus medardicus]QDC50202.1 thiamine phosphate synthase [Methylophilus medardicus]QDC53907.1 thiamine phosphate synthase [Methylophilus medardicus]
MNSSISGVYLVTPDCDDTERLCAQVSLALQGGVSVVQYRHKTASADLRYTQASALLALCRQANVPFLINDHVALAASLDADGVHIGQHDGAITEARAVLGKHKMIGASCYNRFALAVQAQAMGADYVAFGACYPSSTKPEAPKASPDLFTQAKQTLSVPVVGIGGITVANAPPLIAAGADALAVITDIFSASDIAARCQQYQSLFTSH